MDNDIIAQLARYFVNELEACYDEMFCGTASDHANAREVFKSFGFTDEEFDQRARDIYDTAKDLAKGKE